MAYKVLSLKWRPNSFDDVVGQDHIIQTLINAIKLDRVAQGYIFTGPRGVGKTTTARILAMALNAESAPNSKFDPNSSISREISGGRSMDVLEIDGASNRGIEEIRGLREQIKFSPMNCTYKIIIIDEVHMLTNQAFNALLRTLEEPPEHGKFIFATTDIHKVPATIISRCQRFDFNRISSNVIANRIAFIIENENINADTQSINLIAKKADGSMRDGLSLLDQSISFCGNDITYDQLVSAFGIIEHDLYFSFTTSIREKNYSTMMNLMSKFSTYGVSVSEILAGIEEHLRNLIYAGIDNGISLDGMNKELKKQYIDESFNWEKRDLFRVNQVLIDTASIIRKSDTPFLLLEMTSMKLLEMEQSIFIDQLLSKNDMNLNDNQQSDHTSSKKNNGKDENLNKPPNLEKNIVQETQDKAVKESSVKIIDDKISERTSSEENIKTNQLTIEAVKDVWPRVLDEIKNIRPSIGAIVEDFIPISIEDKLINFSSEISQSFNEKVLERGMHVVEKEISNVIGSMVKVKFNKRKNLEKNIPEGKKNNKDLKKDEKVLNKIVNLFDGEILH
ncbi:MAG: DNA polymerase III subunit gamma/tau [Candidatus Neomarinimicrobiota bacterium]